MVLRLVYVNVAFFVSLSLCSVAKSNQRENSLELDCINCIQNRRIYFKVERFNKNQTFCYSTPYLLSEFAIIKDYSCFKPNCLSIDNRISNYNYTRSNFSCFNESRNQTQELVLKLEEIYFIVVFIILLTLLLYVIVRDGIIFLLAKPLQIKLKENIPDEIVDRIELSDFRELQENQSERGEDICGYNTSSYIPPTCSCEQNPETCLLRYVHLIEN